MFDFDKIRGFASALVSEMTKRGVKDPVVHHTYSGFFGQVKFTLCGDDIVDTYIVDQNYNFIRVINV